MARPTGVSGASSASASGPCTASSAVASEMSRSRTFAPRFCATTCAQSAAMLAAFTTSISRSAKRYTRQSSTKVPWSVRIAEYWACPGFSAPTSLHVQAVLRLVPHARLRAFDHLGADLFAPMGREAMQEDGFRIRELHQVRVHRVAPERVAPRLRLLLLPHRRPDVRVHHVRALHS